MTSALASLKNLEPAQRSILIALPFAIAGGAETIMSDVALHLASLGYRITVLTTQAVPPELGDATPWFRRLTNDIYHLPAMLPRQAWGGFVHRLLIDKQIDTIWLAGSAFIYELLPAIKCEFPAVKVVDFLFNEEGHTQWNRTFKLYIDLNMVENASVRKWLLRNGETEERIVTCTLGVDTERYRPAPDKEAAKAALGLTNKFVVGCSGRLSEEKCPEAAVYLAKELEADTDIVVAMTGAGNLEAPLRYLITQLGLERRMKFFGFVPDVLPYLQAYDALILPSKLDGRPTAVLQALSCGVPVIATAVGALPEIISDGKNGFLCPAGRFASAVRRLSRDPELQRHMSSAARAYALEELRNEERLRGFVDAFELVKEMSATESAAMNPEDFDEEHYRKSYPDVIEAINHRLFTSGWEHYLKCGRNEGRLCIAKNVRNSLAPKPRPGGGNGAKPERSNQSANPESTEEKASPGALCIISTSAGRKLSDHIWVQMAHDAIAKGRQVFALVPASMKETAELRKLELRGLALREWTECGTTPAENEKRGLPPEHPYEVLSEADFDAIFVSHSSLRELIDGHLLLLAALKQLNIPYIPIISTDAAGDALREEERQIIAEYLGDARHVLFAAEADRILVERELRYSAKNATTAANPLSPLLAKLSPAPAVHESSAPKVSVIIPCYNYARYLGDCVNSVLRQTFQDFEIIIVNDGSTDNSQEVAESLISANPQARIRLLNQANSGQPAISRNNGIKESTGKYIICLDADDMMDCHMLEKFVDVLDHDNDVHVVYSEAIFFDDEGKAYRETVGDFEIERLGVVNQIFYCSMYRREAWEITGGYKLNVRGYEDWDFWIGCAEACLRGKHLYEPLLFYRTSATGLFGQAKDRDKLLKANIVKNHPLVYAEATRRWADEYLRAPG